MSEIRESSYFQKEETYRMSLNDLFKSGDLKSLYILARYMYKYGSPILTDGLYDELEKEIEERFPDWEYATRSYDDDPDVPAEEIANKYGIVLPEKFLVLKTDRVKRYGHIFTEEASKSIDSIESYESAYNWINQIRGLNLLFSLKVNGINTKTALTKEEGDGYEPRLCLSRGRSAKPFDITECLSKKFFSSYQIPVKNVDEPVIVFGEAYVESNTLPNLRKLTNKDFKTPRSTALSMLRVPLPDEYYECMRLKVFKATNLSDKLSEGLEILGEAGFDVAPYLLIEGDSIPTEFGEFKEWLKLIMKHFENISEEGDIEADGVVVEIDDQVQFRLQGEKGHYNLGNKAFKFERWAPDKYKSKVVKLHFEQRKEQASVRAEIEPVIMSNGNEVKFVNCFNLDIVIKNDIKPGSEIYFEYKSDAAVNLLYDLE